MKAYHEAEGVQFFLGDCRDVLAQLPTESVSCVMTSPPFYGLRKYTCPPSIWGGDPDCPHNLRVQPVDGESYTGRKRWQHDGVSRQEMPEAWVKEKESAPHQDFAGVEWKTGGQPRVHGSEPIPHGATCSLCGAWRGWLGLEPTVEMYVEHTIEWLRAVRRVMRKDGVLWLDIDDSRSGSWGDYVAPSNKGRKPKGETRWDRPGYEKAGHHGKPPTANLAISKKNLCLIPQRIAIAAQQDGWIVRSEITITSWMPESAKDRPTDACRKVLMLVKNKHYWYDGQAVRLPQAENSARRAQDGHASGGKWDDARDWSRTTAALRDDRWDEFVHSDGLRNLGSVWDDIPPAAYPDAHFATFAVEEPERCILASCPAEICVKCGKARRWVVKRKGPTTTEINQERPALSGRAHQEGIGQNLDYRGPHTQTAQSNETLGWTDCGCGTGFESGLVLDPFIGTGTTAIAARKLGRRCIGIDASEEYLQQAVTRLTVGDSGIRRMVEARKQGAEQGVLW